MLAEKRIQKNPLGEATVPDSSAAMNHKVLEQAFTLFNQASSELTDAYQKLQQRVEQLTGELAAANGELRHQLEQKEALSQRLGHLLDALPGGVIVVDRQGVVLEANPAAVTLLGGPLLGETWGAVVATRLKATQSPHEWQLAGVAQRRLRLSASALGQDGEILLVHDISEAHAMQQELERHRRLSAMGEMAAALAHQLRTPLATALLYTAHLKKPSLPESERERFADRSLARLRHLESLIQDMLSFVRGNSSALETAALEPLLADICQVMEPQMAARNLTFRARINIAGLALPMDRQALSGALLNLLENAMQACPAGGQVDLSAEQQDAEVVLHVRDNGRGIAPDCMERLFEPFFTTRQEGTGLGLAIVARVVEAHQGRMEVASTPGRGSCFTMRLPLAG